MATTHASVLLQRSRPAHGPVWPIMRARLERDVNGCAARLARRPLRSLVVSACGRPPFAVLAREISSPVSSFAMTAPTEGFGAGRAKPALGHAQRDRHHLVVERSTWGTRHTCSVLLLARDLIESGRAEPFAEIERIVGIARELAENRMKIAQRRGSRDRRTQSAHTRRDRVRARPP